MQVVGITEEQHPARCRLLARWKGIDAPILWDPFNLTHSKVVPTFTLVDEHGVVRYPRAKLEDLKVFLATTYDAPLFAPGPPVGQGDALVGARRAERHVQEAMSTVLWDRTADPSPLIEALASVVETSNHPARTFQLGVAYRMRSESAFAEPGDFGAAITAWRRALETRPDQYVWRRRLQQYGPLTDKPYPFYGWVAEAQAALTSWGEEPEPLDRPLTLSERGLSTTEGGVRVTHASPDPQGKVPRDTDDALFVETAAVFDTTGQTRVARVHVVVRPRDESQTTWHGGTDPLVLWVDVPDGWRVDPRGSALALPEGAKAEAHRFEIEVTAPPDATGLVALQAFVLAPVCRSGDGVCLYMRKDVTIQLVP